ncbi:MAG: hypothetical protein WBE29_04770 [Pseudolabrys sp.]
MPGNQYWPSPKDRLVHGQLQALHAAVINRAFARCSLLPRPALLHNLVNPIREIEGGKEIQEGKARRRVSQEEGDEEGEAGQESEG